VNYLLDTSIALAAIRGRPDAVRRRIQVVAADQERMALTTIALHELWYGVARSATVAENTARLRAFLSGVDVLDFEQEDAAAAGRLRQHLAGSGQPIGPYDVLIAAVALQRQLTLVTANAREFSRVPDLAVEDWTNTPGHPRR